MTGYPPEQVEPRFWSVRSHKPDRTSVYQYIMYLPDYLENGELSDVFSRKWQSKNATFIETDGLVIF